MNQSQLTAKDVYKEQRLPSTVLKRQLEEILIPEMEGLDDIRSPFESMDSQDSVEVVANPIFDEVDCNEDAIQKSAPSSGKWRRVRLAITACSRMRLVVESVLKAVDADKAEKIGTEINLAFAEASKAPLPDALRWPTAEERHCQSIGTLLPKFECKYFRMHDGKLRVQMESVEPVEPVLFHQVASEVSARLDSLTSLSVEPIEGPRDPGPALNADVSFHDFLNEVSRWQVCEQVVDSTHSATISAFDEALQFSQGSTISYQPWDIYEPVSDLPGSQGIFGTSGVWTQSENTSIREANDVMESGQSDQEQHEISDSDSPPKTMQDDPEWKELILNAVTKKIGEIFEQIDQASDRTKLQNTQSDARECSSKLHKEVRHVEGEFNRMFNDLKTTLVRISKSVPGHFEQQLKRAISQVNNFGTKDLRHFVQESNGITRKLDKIVQELKNRNLSVSKMVQNCTSSVSLFVESVLAMTSSFILAADFNRYSNELSRLPHFRSGAAKVV